MAEGDPIRIIPHRGVDDNRGSAIHNAQPDSWVANFGVALNKRTAEKTLMSGLPCPLRFFPRRLIESLSTESLSTVLA